MRIPDQSDTIAAFATPIGGPLAIIRVSGPRALAAAAALWQGQRPLEEPPHRTLRLGRIAADNGILDDQALAVFMPGPRSYTGEDVVELHCHGSPLGTRLVLLELLRRGCRHAEPGEFTRRAFLHGRLDLTQAEAVADLVAAQSEAALHLANRQLDGMLGRRVDALYAGGMDLLTEIESRLDFPEEDLDWRPPEAMDAQFDRLEADLGALLASRHEGEVLRSGVSLVIAGPPNVGKSSLLNAILGRDRAIVTEIPGTTRDTLEECAHIRGIPIRLVDTAGIRDSDDTVERSGIERSKRSLRTAQVILWVFDASRPYAEQAWDTTQGVAGRLLLVGNKRDRMTQPPTVPASLPEPVLTCALTGEGFDALFDAVERAVWEAPHSTESDVAVSVRHAAHLEAALPALADARHCCQVGHWELAAASLRTALADLGRITGRTAEPDVLETIFARFCIGK